MPGPPRATGPLPPRRAAAPPASPGPVVIRFRDGLGIDYVTTATPTLPGGCPLPGWDELTRMHQGLVLTPRFRAVSENELLDLQRRGSQHDPTYRAPDLRAFFELAVPRGVDATTLLRAVIASLPDVRQAWLQPAVSSPQWTPVTADPATARQYYLQPAPIGLGISSLWSTPNSGGEGTRFVDLEQAWDLDPVTGPQDLRNENIGVLFGASRDVGGAAAHGVKVLGVLRAADNGADCVGIASRSAGQVAGFFRDATSAEPAIQDAIVAAATALGPGDVLLIECEIAWDWIGADGRTHHTAEAPTEVAPDYFETIRLASALGVVVVEAAGNGSLDLDQAAFLVPASNPPAYAHWLAPAEADFRDSGAILVGASHAHPSFASPPDPTGPYRRLVDSNHGQRVDCFAWGEDVVTLADASSGTTLFDGTSAAAAIVAGAALVLQGMVLAQYDLRVGGGEMRRLLGDRAPGVNTPAPDQSIGVMPDLGLLATQRIALLPDVFARDNLADTGEPSTGIAWASPDIIVRRSLVADPQAAFGAGSGTEQQDDLSESLISGQTGWVHVRAQNRGPAAATGVSAAVFWSPPATLVTPSVWNPVGTVALPDLPGGAGLACSPGLAWAAPAPGGDFCLVAILDAAEDPAPPLADFGSADRYFAFVQRNNNVVWRNVWVVDTTSEPPVPGAPAPLAEMVPLAFLVTGAPGRAERMSVRAEFDSAASSRAWLELPVSLLARLGSLVPDPRFDVRAEHRYVPLVAGFPRELGDATLPPDLRAQCRVWVPRGATGRVAVRQFWKGREVGRVSWRLVAGPRPR